MRPTPQLEAWTGEFGDAYVARHAFAEWKLPYGVAAFRRILGEAAIESALEVGSNVGLNLAYLQAAFPRMALYAVEPNRAAFDALTTRTPVRLARAWQADVFQLPLDDASVDLAFTAGVLIHIAPDDLERAAREIVRVARRYVLCLEYFSRDPVEISYRGHAGLLFKRDFGGFYLDRFPSLRCVRYGFLWRRELPAFDDVTWWLLEKTGSSAAAEGRAHV